jgi:hypothetical protein
MTRNKAKVYEKTKRKHLQGYDAQTACEGAWSRPYPSVGGINDLKITKS